ncbi:MAG: TIGR00701 family protein, partial [Alphaproteobacteria bacterium]|nr:TIGR00701 family protein [Alphaproteobacteria bacterium]
GWFHAKLTLLVLMQITHAMYARARRHFAQDRNTRSHRFYRVINEIPTVLLVGIVFLVVLKPF